MSRSGKIAWKKVLRWLPGVVISAIAIYAVIRFSHMQDISEALKSVRLSFILVMLALSVLSLAVRAIAWRTILGRQVSFPAAFFGVSEGYFLNNLFPLRLGELGRALSVGRSSGLGILHVLSTIIIERAFDIVYAAGIVLLTLPLVVGADWIKPIAMIAFAVVLLGLLVLYLVANNREKFQSWISKRNFRSKFITERLLPQVTKIIDGMSALVKPSQFLLSVFWIGMTWVVWMVMYYYTVTQLAANPPLWWGLFIAGLLALGVAVPSAPAALGVYEGSLVGALAILGVSTGSALAYAVILHLIQIVVTAIFGLWGLIRDGQNLTTLFSTLSNQKKVEELESNEGL